MRRDGAEEERDYRGAQAETASCHPKVSFHAIPRYCFMAASRYRFMPSLDGVSYHPISGHPKVYHYMQSQGIVSWRPKVSFHAIPMYCFMPPQGIVSCHP